MRVRAGFLLALLLNLASAQYNPLKDPNICGRPTCKGNEKFQYKPGMRHQYKYYIDLSSSFKGTSTNKSTLHVQGLVNLEFISECDGLLSITDLKLSEKPDSYNAEEDIDIDSQAHPQSELFSEEISNYPLRFSFNDGIISELCPDEEEKNWALNFKRGLLSMLHNTMKRFDLDYTSTEDDVRGSCATTYTVQGARDTSLSIEKLKDLTTCESRSKVHSILQSTPYHFRSNYRGESLMRSTSKCELSVDHHVYNEIRCEEAHIFQPFSNKAAGATTEVKQRLILMSEMNITIGEQPLITRRVPLLYDHVPTPKPTSGELKTSRDLLKKVCQLSADDTQTEFSDIFTRFVHTARLLSDAALFSLYENSPTICPTGKKHMLDALPFLGSSPSVNLIKDIILTKGVSESTTHEWILAVSFIPRPTTLMLKALSELLEGVKNDASITLGIATLTHTFCTQNQDCLNIEPVKVIVELLENEAIDAFQKRGSGREEDERLIVSLKALANIGVVSESFKEELYRMIEEDSLNVGIRVAAVQAFRRLPCEETRSYFEKIFRQQGDVEAEVRIAAYLQIMRCPNYLVIRAIKHSLQVEEVNQVGSFIWSHLHNLLKSSIPSRVEIQSLLSDKDLGKKFSSDVRKFSHNYEGSVFFEEYNVGANYEGNVIFSTSSYIPRAAMLNFTVDLFGESINLLEIDGRIEGFEHYLESIFGPKGEYNSKKLHEKIPKLRWPRSASDSELLKSQIDNVPYTLKTNFANPKVAVGLKIFGNEIKYSTLNGKEEIHDVLRTLNPIDHLKRILSGKEISYNKAVMFLDSSYVVPSGAGLPITLNAVGTASINMKLFGSLRTVDFMKTKELDLIGSFQPSAALDIIGTMSADLYYANTAIKLKTNMYTSSAVEGAVKIKGSELVSIKFSLPKEKTEIFGVQSELIVVNGDEEEKQEGLEDNRVNQSSCSWPAIDKTIGLKLCAHYYFANVTKIGEAPYFPLAGPAAFQVSLEKADPTAKTYLLEYRWDKSEDGSVVQIAFDTPGSSERRFIGANFTLDTESHNITLLMQSAAGTILAKGKYKNTDDEKYLHIGLDIDNKKHLDTLIALERHDSRNGQTYIPKFYLGVNGERVAELQGSLKWVTKKGISQCDVDLKFQTKRLTSKLFGYISKSDASIGANMKLDYKFVNTKEQRSVVEFTLANRSTRTLAAIHGDFKVETTAYPHFNFEAVLKYQKATGRMECKFEINSSPDLRNLQEIDPNRLTILLLFTHKTTQDGIRFNAITSVTKPISDLDLRAEFSYDVRGPNTEILLLARYAKEKNVAISVFWSHPRGSYEHFEGRLNVTLPSFTPMVLEGKLHERLASDYDVEFAGTWFSGHSARARGIYQDKSTSMSSNHHIKFLIKSSSFREINLDGQFYRDNTEFKIDLKANHDSDDYGLFFKHIATSQVEVSTQARVKYRTAVYSFSSLLSLRQRKQILLEIHFDQYRDVHLAIWGYNKEAQKGAGFEIKWDANRDPNQKFVVTVEVSNPKFYNYMGNFVVSYPGRTINGVFDFLFEDGHFATLARLAWSSKDMIALQLTADLKTTPEMLFILSAEFITPLEDWRKTSFNMGYRHVGNMYRLNGSVYWYHDQHVSIDLFGDYFSAVSKLRCEYRAALVSTLQDVPSLSAALKHSHNKTTIDSNIHVMYHPQQEISLESLWHIDEDNKMKNLTGTVQMSSPFEDYRKGLLVSKIYVTKDRDLRGVADLDLDHRKFTASVEGHLKRFSKSMFVFNITTPIEKYKRVTGRLGFSEENRHLVALIQYPVGTIGFEMKFLVESIADFDIKFYVATPIDFLQEAILVANLKQDRADFRVGWNSLLAGFTGVWHYANVTDFEYSYKIYTPIEGFEENGVVAKLILKEGLDLEVSVKLAENRLGVTVVGQPKPRILNELGIKTQAIYIGKLARELSERMPDNDDFERLDDEDPISWSGLVKIDTLIYPTVEGTLDVDQKGTVYVILSELTLPDGRAQLKDEFNFIDFFTMKNSLRLTTPYQAYKIITSEYEFLININKHYLLLGDINYLNNTQWTRMGGKAEYFFKGGEDEEMVHNVTFHVHTPFKSFPRLNLFTALEMEENVYRFNFALTTNSSNISVDASAEVDDGLVDANVATHVLSPLITLPQAKFNFKKDFSELENRIELHFDMLRNKPYTFNVIGVWKYNNITNFRVNVDIETPLRSLEKSEVGAMVLVSHNNNALAELHLMLHPINLNVNATIQDNELYSWLLFEFNQKRHDTSWRCTLVEKQPGMKEIRGQLTMNEKAFVVNGLVEVQPRELPKGLKIQIEPQGGGPAFNFEYLLKPQTLGGHVFSSKIGLGSRFVHCNAEATILDMYNWDANLNITTSHVKYKYFMVDIKANKEDGRASLDLNAQTPLENLEHPRIGLSSEKSGPHRKGKLFYELTRAKGSLEGEWCWLLMENMTVRLISNHETANYTRKATIEAFYINLNKSFDALRIGAEANINGAWRTGSNLKLSVPSYQRIDLEAAVQLPKPSNEVHTVKGKLHTADNFHQIDYFANYRTKVSAKKYGSAGSISYLDGAYIIGNIGVEWGERRVNNYVELGRRNNTLNFTYKLRTPKYDNQDALSTNVTYKIGTPYHNLTWLIFQPANRSMLQARVSFKELANMNGTLNVTTPFERFKYVGAHFAAATSASVYNRYMQIFWPNNTALLDSKCTIKMGASPLMRDTLGVLLVEVPLATRHTARVDYSYIEKPQVSTGRATVDYNHEKILEGKYNCLSEARVGFDKDTIHVELENKLVPIGVAYVHGYEYGAPGEDSTTVDSKRLEVYHLHNRTGFNVTGEMVLRKTFSGQEIALTAIHTNRTVKFWTDYDVLDQRFKQHSKLELGSNVWISYDVDLLNKTEDESSEAQEIHVTLSYPKRTFLLFGAYNMTNTSFSSEASLLWDQKSRSIEAAFDWRKDATRYNRQEVELQFKHPSFEKNVSILGEYETTERRFVDMHLTVDYSLDPEKRLQLNGVVEDNSDNTVSNYTYRVWGSHPATNLELRANGGICWKPKWYYTHHLADYKRTYLPLQSGESTGRIDLVNKEIELKKKTLRELSYFWGRYSGGYPLYTTNISALHGNDINASGEFYLNFREKLVKLELNITEDGSQSMHAFGEIPDARSAVFDLWRDYEDIHVSDISYFLRLNHSRLIVSSLKWRPEIKQDIQNAIRAASVGLYNDIMENTDYWRHYIRSETASAIADVWVDAKPLIENFLDDLKDLKVVEQDFEELKTFLNTSYYDNEFYVRDLVGFVMYVVDELSIRSHIESLPVIVSEIWEVMGESGKKIQKGILWVIERIKTYYKNAAEFVNGLVQGDSVEHISEALKQLLEKYDNFIKEMHVNFIKYVEQLWKQTYNLLIDNWHKTLAAIEPTFIKMLHYLESVAWSASKEFLDFLYIRKSEFIESPYFNKLSNFTHDLDKFYRDMNGNDTLWNVYKYSKVVSKFVRERFVKLIPFGKEVQAVISEIVMELKELKNLRSIEYLTNKYLEMYRKAKWFYDYFDVGNRIHRFIALVHLKLTDMTQTALQAENRYRQAKTKFIFEPNDGIMYLEQKLPMSWHAFNESPKFQEIPEYKAINDVENYFVTSRTSFWNFYYDYKPYTDPADWFPPFKANAMIAGSQFYVTFDRSYYNFKGGCTYLLASDLLDRNFSLAISYNQRDSHLYELILLTNNTAVHIDLASNSVKIEGRELQYLPAEVGDMHLYQESDVVTLDSSSGFTLQCNLKFNVCMLEISGWYFGKTAGLWGTMNNEPSDDLLMADGHRVSSGDVSRLAKSWALDRKCSFQGNRAVTEGTPSADVRALCEALFQSKVSPFSTCFPRVSAAPFLDMCLNSTTENDTCTAAVAYMHLCAVENTPLRIPASCVKCNLENTSVVPEGEFIRFEGNEVPRSTDIVFIVEAKECNLNLKEKRSIDILIEVLHKELSAFNITQNRYSVVLFGGDGVFDQPRSVAVNSHIFAPYQSVNAYFDNIPAGKGNSDIFGAIVYATKLIFRPGVSKTFILLPCTDCNESNMKLDYAMLHQLLVENDITLHILMNEDFRFPKSRVSKIFFGVDRFHAFTRKDVQELKGDIELKKQARLSKSTLGFCTPLALETNGSVFSGRKLENSKRSAVRKVATVFSKRVALTAEPSGCQVCECTAPNTGVSYMECFPCHYPTPTTIDYGFDDDDTLLDLPQSEEDDFNDASE